MTICSVESNQRVSPRQNKHVCWMAAPSPQTQKHLACRMRRAPAGRKGVKIVIGCRGKPLATRREIWLSDFFLPPSAPFHQQNQICESQKNCRKKFQPFMWSGRRGRYAAGRSARVLHVEGRSLPRRGLRMDGRRHLLPDFTERLWTSGTHCLPSPRNCPLQWLGGQSPPGMNDKGL